MDAIDIDDNCELFGNVDKRVNFSDTSSVKSGKTRDSTPMEADAIADLVIKKMNKMFKPAVRAQNRKGFKSLTNEAFAMETILHFNVR